MFKRLFVVLVILAITRSASATVVRFDTVLGSYNIRMFDSLMPETVANFLNYTNTNRYNGTFVHRSVSGFVIQGGGFTYNSSNNTAPGITLSPPINDEPGGGVAGPSNIRGTIAMAKSGPNTVTSQWFVNLGNNSSLDNPARPDGGFSAFGRVLGNGMTVVDAIAALPIFDLDPFPQQTFDTVPLRNVAGGLADRLVFSNDVSVLNIPAGDYNFDGTVNSQDLNIWKADFGSMTKAEADGNGNGIVDGADFLIWQRTFGQTTVPISAFAVVPEPTSVALAALGCLFLVSRRR
ncbi:peptidylprolyl isomerase [Bythopirellula polymerisocia]|nr:peptidylprolyl isomerase [Bythopirellula polymerisocia]